jgi:uncharacterized protein YrrD
MNLVLVTSLFGLPVLSLHERMKVGSVSTALFDTDQGLLVGFLVKPNIFSKPYFLNPDEIDSIDTGAIIIKKADDLAPLEEVVRANKIYRSGFKIIGLSVKTQDNKRLGKVSDLSVSLSTGVIHSLYVQSFLKEIIIPRERVIEITKKSIIVNDDTSIPSAIPEAELS